MRSSTLGGQYKNRIMADPSHDNYSRERFVQEYIWKMNTSFHKGLNSLYKNKTKPTDGDELRPNELRKKLLGHPYGQMWSSLRRIAREWTCEAVGPTVEMQIETLIERSIFYQQNNKKIGSLFLDSKIKIPRYIDVDIHLKPGGYTNELCPNDVFAGAEYERTTYLNTNGHFGSKMDALGCVVTNWVKKTYPALNPRRILEIGCAIGQSTLAWKDAFPNAKVYGIDLGAPLLRYGHARAESLGREIHFSQQNAEETNFPSEYFDLVVSHATMHETSTKALRNILAESRRILLYGGVMVHNDGTPFRDLDPVGCIIPEWDTHYNAEPFISKMRSMDLAEYAVSAGWPKGSTRNDYATANNTNYTEGSLDAYYLLVGEKK